MTNNNQTPIYDSKTAANLLSVAGKSAGICLSGSTECEHRASLSCKTSCFCNYCNLLFKLFSFYNKHKCALSRGSFTELCGLAFSSAFRSAKVLLNVTSLDLADPNNAALASSHWTSGEHACPFFTDGGVNHAFANNTYGGSICNYAQHLFECSSTCDQVRGEYFPISRESTCWYATCSGCSASCAFASPREGMILIAFLSMCELQYDGRRYTFGLRASKDRIPCTRAFAMTYMIAMDRYIPCKSYEIHVEDPEQAFPLSDVYTGSCAGIDYGIKLAARCPREGNFLESYECSHTFVLHSTTGISLNLTHEMFRLLITLMPSHGYISGATHIGEVITIRHDACGLLSAGGFMGVNLRCNELFMLMHRHLYNGGFRSEIQNQPFLNLNVNCGAFEVTAEAQMYSSSDEVEEEPRVLSEEDIDDIVDRLAQFQADDDNLLEMPVLSQTRGLKDLAKRVGGLLKGVTNCVSKLHAVWDWPLDTALKAIQNTGEWLEENKQHVDTTTWACQVCPEVQADMAKANEEQGKINDLLKAALLKLSTTLDAVTAMNKTNFESLESKLAEVSKRPTAKGVIGSSDIKRFENLETSVKQLQDAIMLLLRRPQQDDKEIKPRPQGSSSQVGEQMAIPRRRFTTRGHDIPASEPQRTFQPTASKQAGDTEFIGGESTSSQVDSSFIKNTTDTDEHDAMRAKLYLGSVTWKVSDGEDSSIKIFDLPNDMWSSSQRLKGICQYFQYYTCDGLDFYITTTSVPMQGGTLMVTWDAMGCATRQKIATNLQLSSLPSAYIHASSSGELTFSVSSSSIQSIMCTAGSEGSFGNLGKLIISVANGLNAPKEVSQSIPLNVWVRFRNPSFSFWTMRHDIVTSQMMGLDSLGGIESMEATVAQGVWSSTSSVNLIELTVHPTACHVKNGLVTQTPLSIVSSLFNRWRGSLKYRFVFGASLFVKGKLAVCSVPVMFRDTKLTVDQLMSFPTMVCDLSSENREFTFEVPYISVGMDSYTTLDALYDVSSYNADFVVSRLHAVILDPLVMNANASNSISYFVTMAPGSDFELRHMSGVKAEYVNRTLKQSFGTVMKSSRIMGTGYSSWCSSSSVLAKFVLDAEEKNALHIMVAPFYRSMAPCTTSLSWLSQLFVQWSGSLVYTLRSHSNKIKVNSYVRIWYDENGSTQSGEESEFLSEVDPPAGAIVKYWSPGEQSEYKMVVKYCARTPKLMLNKARYEPGSFDWMRYYNGALVIDYEGKDTLSVELSVAGGEDFEMYEQTAPPMCGKVSEAFTVLSYQKKLGDITTYPIHRERLGGPTNKSTVTPVKFAKVAPVTEEEKPAPTARRGPREGDEAEDEDGQPIIFSGGRWVLDTEPTAQMNGCFPGMSDFKRSAKSLAERDTCEKLMDIVERSHETMCTPNGPFVKLVDIVEKGHESMCAPNGSFDKLMEVAQALMPVLETTKRVAGSIENKLIYLEKMKDTITGLLKPLLKDSIPGMVHVAMDHDAYLWATLLTLIGGVSILWACKSKKKFKKKLAIFCMIIWAPLISKSVLSLGVWIREHILDCFDRAFGSGTCRKHSMAGAFEGVKESLGDFSGWFNDNWAIAVQSLLSILGVVASLIVWGTIPDEKNLQTFAAKFKAAGDKGRSFTNIFAGFSSINKLSAEWSQKLVQWILSMSNGNLPKEDSALQQMLTFDLRSWVEETREMALQENRFTGFGADTHLIKVRHLYDRSQVIQRALIDGCKVDVQLGMIIKECKDKCVELMNESYTFKGMKKPRIDPIHICMLGKPGVGKSVLSHVLINNLLDHRGEPEVDRIYTRCCADAYWSNYHQEPVILYDDLGAIKSNLKLSDFAEIMGVKTNDPFSVPMAGVEDKGKHCTSRYVFSCTNVMELDDTGDVVTKLAYYRRRNILVRVEIEEGVERDESNPTKGLLFTVMGHTIQGANNDRVTFDVKRDWPESFLRDIDTSEWLFERVSYRTFLGFVCRYTDAYMASQEKLITGINTFKMDPFTMDDEEVEAQADDTIMTIDQLCVELEARKCTGKEFTAAFAKTRYEAPDAWNTNKVLTVKQLLHSACGCAENCTCDFNMFVQRLGEISLLEDFRAYKYFKTKRLSAKPGETQILVIKDFSALKPWQILYFITTVYSWCLRNEICPLRASLKAKNAKEKMNMLELDNDKRIPQNPVFENDCTFWEACGYFFPRSVAESGCVAIYDGEKFLYLCADESLKCKQDVARKFWPDTWCNSFSKDINPLLLMPLRDRDSALVIAGQIEDFGTGLDFSADVRQALDEAKTFLTPSGYLTFILYLSYLNCDKANALRQEAERLAHLTSFTASSKFKVYEKRILGGVSPKVRILMAIGGGVIAAGLLVGAFFGLKSLLTKTHESICDTPAEPEVSGAHESDGLVTRPPLQQRRKAHVTMTTVDRHFSGSHESDPIATAGVVTQRRKPALREGGMGVTYDDSSDLSRSMRAEKKRAFRRGVRKAAKLALSSEKTEMSEILGDIALWQKGLAERGVSLPTPAETGPLASIVRKNLMEGEELKSKGALAEDSGFTHDPDIQRDLEAIVKSELAEAPTLIAEGTSVKYEKQATVGKYGLNRDVNMVNLVTTHIGRMSCTILRCRAGLYKSYGVLRLKGTFIICPAHYLSEFEEKEELYFVCLHKVARIPFDPTRVKLVSGHQDLVVWDLGKTVPPSIDYTGHIPTSADWQHFKASSGVLSITKYSHEGVLQLVHTLDNIELTSADIETPTGCYEMLDSQHTILSGLRYRVHCMPGFCGAAILKADTKAVRKIIGIHVAGQKERGVGYAETLTLEPILAAMAGLSQSVIIASTAESPVALCEKHATAIEGKGNLGLIGVLEKSCIPNIPTKTTIAKSIIHGLLGDVKTEPSILSAWDHRLGDKRGVWNPVLEAVKKYGVPTVPFPPSEIAEVEVHLSNVFAGCENSLRKREVNNLEIGINGIELTDYWSPVEMKTSAGYPYVQRKPANASGKAWLFKQVGQYSSGRAKYEMEDPLFVKSFTEMEQDILRGVAPRITTMECCKDERRKLSKIYGTPATRTFTILPPEINILFRMYFGDFAAMVMTTRQDHFSQVGINPESMEWSELMMSLKRVGSRGFAGDYAKFDGIGSAEIYHSITNVVNNWYNDGPTNARARHALISSIVHRDGICGDLLLRYSQGMPSGFAMTVIFNSFVNYYYMGLAWMHIVSKSNVSPQADLPSFDYFTKIIVYGDDNVVAVDDAFLEVYNLRTVASYLSGYGITYTDDAKNPIHLSEPHVGIESVTFLKRAFVKAGQSGLIWRAPLDKTSIEERCNWIRECEIPDEAMMQNVESALYEASIHGKEYFDDLLGRINDALDRVAMPQHRASYIDDQKRWWANMTGDVLTQPDLSNLVAAAGQNHIDLNWKCRHTQIGDNVRLSEVLSQAKFVKTIPFLV